MIQAQRVEYIMQNLKAHGIVSISELTHALNASRSTIHRDLCELESQNRLKCIRGGAVSLTPKASFEPSYNVRQDFFSDEKQRIARVALEFVQENDTLLLDGGTTVLELAKLLNSFSSLYIATDDLHIAMELSVVPGITLMILGGTVRTNHFTINGLFAEEMLQRIHADTTFLSVDAVDPAVGLMGFSVEELQVKRLMVKASQKTIVLCDHSKFETVAFASICALQDVMLIITGKELNPDIKKKLEDSGVKLLLV